MKRSPAFSRLLPEQRGRVAPWIVGLITFVTLTIGAAGLGILGSVLDLQQAGGNRWLLQVNGPRVDFDRSVKLLSIDPRVDKVAPVPEETLRTSLESWLGPASRTAALPLPQIADVTLLRPDGGEALARHLTSHIPTARLTAYEDELQPMLSSLKALGLLVGILLFILALTMAAAVILAARATLDSNRATLEILHGIGATDEQLLSLLQRRIALDALIGGVIGGALAALVLTFALLPARGMLVLLANRPLLSLVDLAILFLLPFLQAALATLVARRALQKALSATI